MTQRIVASAPGRTGIVGNPTDMYGGSVLSCTTQERAVCEIIPAEDMLLTVGDLTATVRTQSDLAARNDIFDLLRAVLRGRQITPATHRFRLRTATDIPMQAGLAGSTALVAAIYGAVSAYLGVQESPYTVAEAIRRIEYEQMGVICGFQDQYMTVFGGLNFLDFREKGSHIAPDAQPFATVEPLATYTDEMLPFILANTGVKHHSGSAHKPVRTRWLDGDRAVIDGYERLAALARESKAALLRGDYETLADAMNENLAVQQGFGASGAACDHLAAVARQNGALAAKLAGAGHGGTVLVLTHDPKRTADALTNAGAARILAPRPSPGLSVEVIGA